MPKQPDEEMVLLTHPIHGERSTEGWIARHLLAEDSGWKRSREAAVPEKKKTESTIKSGEEK